MITLLEHTANINDKDQYLINEPFSYTNQGQIWI
jgi:hypothetical protein